MGSCSGTPHLRPREQSLQLKALHIVLARLVGRCSAAPPPREGEGRHHSGAGSATQMRTTSRPGPCTWGGGAEGWFPLTWKGSSCPGCEGCLSGKPEGGRLWGVMACSTALSHCLGRRASPSRHRWETAVATQALAGPLPGTVLAGWPAGLEQQRHLVPTQQATHSREQEAHYDSSGCSLWFLLPSTAPETSPCPAHQAPRPKATLQGRGEWSPGRSG